MSHFRGNTAEADAYLRLMDGIESENGNSSSSGNSVSADGLLDLNEWRRFFIKVGRWEAPLRRSSSPSCPFLRRHFTLVAALSVSWCRCCSCCSCFCFASAFVSTSASASAPAVVLDCGAAVLLLLLLFGCCH
jgi:hypothetical protein